MVLFIDIYTTILVGLEVIVLIIHQHTSTTTPTQQSHTFNTSTHSFTMYSKALLALAPVAAQAAQSARWPVFNLRANVTEQYIGYGAEDWDRREFWHNAPIGEASKGDVTGPLFDVTECRTPVRAGLNDHGK